MALTFPAKLRLKSGPQFKAVYDAKQSRSNGTLIIYRLKNGLDHPRLGLSVSRKVGNAVRRNRWKRLIRESFRHLQHDLPKMDYVVLPRLGVEPTSEAVFSAWQELTRIAIGACQSPERS